MHGEKPANPVNPVYPINPVSGYGPEPLPRPAEKSTSYTFPGIYTVTGRQAFSVAQNFVVNYSMNKGNNKI